MAIISGRKHRELNVTTMSNGVVNRVKWIRAESVHVLEHFSTGMYDVCDIPKCVSLKASCPRLTPEM